MVAAVVLAAVTKPLQQKGNTMRAIIRITNLDTGATVSRGIHPTLGVADFDVVDYANELGLHALPSRDLGIDGIRATVLTDGKSRPVSVAVVHPVTDNDDDVRTGLRALATEGWL